MNNNEMSVTFDKNCEPQKGAHQDVEHLESLKKESRE